jgi:hypothetical protein
LHEIASGGIPASVIYTNSLALEPCGHTPQSVPKAIFTPALYALRNVSWIFGPIASAFGTITAG